MKRLALLTLPLVAACTPQEQALWSFYAHLNADGGGAPPIEQAQCVMWFESRGENVVSRTGDFGPWQVNRRTWQPVFPNDDLLDPITNGAIAAHVYREGERVWGNGWRPWVGARRCGL